jgi:hypothetical protein
MRESRKYGSVRGALSNERPYRDREHKDGLLRCARNDEGFVARMSVATCG